MEEFKFSELGLSDKEEKILVSAIKIFSEKGFDGTTTSEIAKDAGVAEGTIFKYYKTKKGILTQILIHLINIMSDKVILGSIEKILQNSAEKSMKEIIKEIFYDRSKLVDSIFPMAKVIFHEAMIHEDVRDAIYEKIIKRALELFTDFYKKFIERGLIRNDIEPIILFRTILANIGIMIAQRKLFGDKLYVKDPEKELDTVIDIILHGIEKKQN
jgi:AcrR family transcriptional regulator